MLAGGKIDGKLYGVNLGNNSQAFVIDVDAFKKAGIDLPPADWTWDDFEKICLELHEKLGIWGMGGGVADQQLWKSVYLGYGQWVYAKDGKSLGYTDDQYLINHMKMLRRLIDAGAYPPRDVELSEYFNAGPEGSAIVKGKAAMVHFWSNQLTAIWSAAGQDRNFTMAHVPRPKDGCCSGNYIKPSMFFAITSQAKHPKEAAMFIDFFINSLDANKILMAERGVPVSSVIRKELKEMLDRPQREAFDFLERVQAYCSPLPPSDPPLA